MRGGPGRHAVRVVVPLERVEALGHAAQHRIVGGSFRQLDGKPADLGLARWANVRVRCLGEQLRTETDPEHGFVQVEQPLQEEVLVAQPRVVALLVGYLCLATTVQV